MTGRTAGKKGDVRTKRGKLEDLPATSLGAAKAGAVKGGLKMKMLTSTQEAEAKATNLAQGIQTSKP